MGMVILISSAGRRVELIKCFREDAERLEVSLRVIAVDLNPTLSAACQIADEAYAVPRAAQPDFPKAILEICRREKVALVIPTIDTELAAYARVREEFARTGVSIAVSGEEVISICRDKLKTAVVLSQAGIPTPRTALLADAMRQPEQWRMPVIIKPRGGSSSVGLKYLPSLDLLEPDADLMDSIVQERLSGDEYTVNMYFDHAGSLRTAVPHRRIETRGGEVSKGVSVNHAGLRETARKMASVLQGARGVLCFQAFVDPASGSVQGVIEINGRFGGGFPLAHRSGARFSQWMIEEVCGRPSSAADNWKDGVTMLRYDAAVFLND